MDYFWIKFVSSGN